MKSSSECSGAAESRSPAGGEAAKDAQAGRVVKYPVNAVAFGGGTGMAALLRGLRDRVENAIAVVTVTDNGGSSGRLRKDFDIVPPGDIRNCLLALADVDDLMQLAFTYRFKEGEFKGHCFGNLFITVLTRIVGDFEHSIKELHRLLNVRGKVLPAASGRISLVAHHPDGTKSTGEVQITRSGKPISKIELRPSPVRLSVEIADEIERADFFLFGPGSLYTSVIPNLLVEGLMETVNKTGKPRIYIANIMTQRGETQGYKLSHHLRALRAHIGSDFPDCVIAHRGKLPRSLLERYQKEGAEPVVNDLEHCPEFRDVTVIEADVFAGGDTIRHDSIKLAELITSTFSKRGA
jgi:uncharacterized cofD-like protein